MRNIKTIAELITNHLNSILTFYEVYCVGFRTRQAMSLQALEPGSVGAWLAVPKT